MGLRDKEAHRGRNSTLPSVGILFESALSEDGQRLFIGIKDDWSKGGRACILSLQQAHVIFSRHDLVTDGHLFNRDGIRINNFIGLRVPATALTLV